MINESTLLIAHETEYNSFYIGYSSSLIHIPSKYQYVNPKGSCQPNMASSASDRWYITEKKYVYKDQLDSSKYWYRHEGKNDELTNYHTHNNGKIDRSSSWITSSIHYYGPIGSVTGMSSSSRQRENKLYYKPSLFLSASQKDVSSIVTSTPYFISLLHWKQTIISL